MAMTRKERLTQLLVTLKKMKGSPDLIRSVEEALKGLTDITANESW